jgi:hypothetical protein
MTTRRSIVKAVQSIVFNATLRPLETPSSSSTHLCLEGALSGTRLGLSYSLEMPAIATNGLNALAWEPHSGDFCETLWKKTCFELFLGDPSSERYWEWNFAAHGGWAAFSFAGPRQRAPHEARRDAGPRSLSVEAAPLKDGVLRLQTEIDLSFSPFLSWACLSGSRPANIEISLNAISEDTAGERIHWGLRHANSGCADFHLRQNFVLLSELAT